MDSEKLRELIFRIQEKDRAALEQLYSCMKTSVYSLALVYTKSSHDAEDIMQNTFLQIWSRASSFRGDSAKSWVLSIARNLAVDYIRAGKRVTELSDSIPEKDDCYEKITDSLTVKLMFRHLKNDEREIVLLYSYGYSFREIAAVVNKSDSSVHRKYQNALRKLKKLSGGDNDE